MSAPGVKERGTIPRARGRLRECRVDLLAQRTIPAAGPTPGRRGTGCLLGTIRRVRGPTPQDHLFVDHPRAGPTQ